MLQYALMIVSENIVKQREVKRMLHDFFLASCLLALDSLPRVYHYLSHRKKTLNTTTPKKVPCYAMKINVPNKLPLLRIATNEVISQSSMRTINQSAVSSKELNLPFSLLASKWVHQLQSEMANALLFARLRRQAYASARLARLL